MNEGILKHLVLNAQGLFRNIDMPSFDLTDLVMSLIKTDAVKDFTAIEDWITEGDLDGMTPQKIANEWDNLPLMETE